MEMKLCMRCSTEKPVSEFNRRGTKFQGRCRSCQSDWYQANRSQHVANVRKRQNKIRTENKAKMIEYLRRHPCVDCGEDDVIVLEFDHVRGEKTRSVGIMVGQAREWWRIEEEIAKCEVRCCNCHRKATARRAGNWARSVPVE